MKVLWATIRKNQIRYTRFMFFFLFGTIVVAVSDVLITRLTGSIGEAAVGLDTGVIIQFLLAMALISGIKILVGALVALFSKRFSGKTLYQLRHNFAEHFFRLSYKDLSRKNSGDMLSLYTNELPKTAELLTINTFDLVTDGIVLLVSGIFMFVISPWYSLFFFLLFPILTLIQVKISKPIQVSAAHAAEHRGQFNSVVNDSLQNTSTVLAYSLEGEMEERYLKSYSAYYEAMMQHIKAFTRLVVSGIVAAQIPSLFVYGASAIAVANGNMSIGEFIAYTTIAASANSGLTMLSQRLGTLRQANAAAHRLNGEMDGDLEAKSKTSLPQVSVPSNDAVIFDNVSFSYTEGAQILNNISFHIGNGENIAIVGPSGCGKSTILKLLLSLYHPDSGKLTVMGNSLQDMPESSAREMIAYVPQDNFLFPTTIQENITCSAKELNESEQKRLHQACRDAGILSFIQDLPNGFRTILTEAAENLSGGQRQRLSIARALYKDAPIILLDEATSALDPLVENAVLDSLYSSSGGKTIITVAHRLAAVRSCDLVFVIDKGQIAEKGSFQELMAKQGYFYNLYQMQLEEEYHD